MMGELMDAVGALAEMSLLFYKATINAGATEEQANILITAFLRASLQKNGAFLCACLKDVAEEKMKRGG